MKELAAISERPNKSELEPENVLFCGWRSEMAQLVATLDEFAPPSSHLWIHCGVEEEARSTLLRAGAPRTITQPLHTAARRRAR